MRKLKIQKRKEEGREWGREKEINSLRKKKKMN